MNSFSLISGNVYAVVNTSNVDDVRLVYCVRSGPLTYCKDQDLTVYQLCSAAQDIVIHESTSEQYRLIQSCISRNDRINIDRVEEVRRVFYNRLQQHANKIYEIHPNLLDLTEKQIVKDIQVFADQAANPDNRHSNIALNNIKRELESLHVLKHCIVSIADNDIQHPRLLKVNAT
jgi:hypothetical protein